LFELYELRTMPSADPADVSLNWFSMECAMKVYGAYLALDQNHNGMLNRNELRRFGKGMLTDVFVDRVFEEYQTYIDPETGEREMDYKLFIEFVLAMEHIGTKQGIQYLWKLIDINHCGYIDSHVISYFFGDVARILQTKLAYHGASDEIPLPEDVKDEIFDMVKPEDPGRITKEDLERCGQGGTILSMLIDAAAFWRYDNREAFHGDYQDDDEDDDDF
jgi:Ca2+-binding EF-hand superfamily protein